MENNIKLFVDMDGTLAEWRKAASYEHLFLDDYFYTLKPHRTLIRWLNKIQNENKNVEVYVASSYILDKHINEKNLWLDKYFPIPEDRRIFIPEDCKKSECVSKFLNEQITINHILLDDFTQNLVEWENNGGTSIKALNGINKLDEKWKGLALDIFKLKFLDNKKAEEVI